MRAQAVEETAYLCHCTCISTGRFALPIRSRRTIVATSVLLIVAGPAGAQGVCPQPQGTGFVAAPGTPTLGENFLIDAGDLQSDDAGTRFSDGVVIQYRDGEIRAEGVSFSADGASVEVVDNVSLVSDMFSITGEDARIDRLTETVTFGSAAFEIPERTARGSAQNIVFDANEVLTLTDLSFTTCPEDQMTWELRIRESEIDPNTGFGSARGVTFRWRNVPVLRLPRFSFPIDDRRKSGFLAPRFSDRDRTGLDLTIPYYINLAPNYDLLLEPRYMQERGLQINSRFRYLLPRSVGQFDVENLPDDSILNRSRHFVSLAHESNFSRRWQLLTGIEDVSDAAYFEDLGDSLGVISQTHLDRFVDLVYYGNRWSMLTRVREYQTIDTQIAAVDRPYKREPQMLFAGRWGDRVAEFESTAEAIKFDRDIGETGWRLDSTHELSLRFARAGMYLTPAIGYRQTNYRLDGTVPGSDRSLARGLPVASIDSGLRFEREAGGARSWIQTIEPRVLYVNIPFEDQTALPVFDTILPDFNPVQLFSKYEYVGPDRVADADQVSFGLTSRLIESASGRERLSATVGQTRYREPRRVLLPGEATVDATRSNYVAELAVYLSDKWNLDLGYQWNGETEETVRTETRFEFRPQDDRLFGLGYRLREGLLEQGDLSMIWPLFERWRVIGQYSYSLLDEKPLERFAGIEYEGCCWRLRLTNRRFVVRSTGQTDSTVSIQLELKGFAQRSATPEELLGRGILGYRRLDQLAN